jgi:GT2 family glycosyltransferase
VLVSIVTYQSGRTIAGCLQSLAAQTFRDFKVIVTDNASTDETLQNARSFDVELVEHRDNLGFCAAHNQVIDRCNSRYVLVLNPDMELSSRFLEGLLEGAHLDSRIGGVCGKLLRLSSGLRSAIIDSAGMILRSGQRHFDRGAGEADRGQYDQPGYVFGATGAGVLYRREFINDVRQGGDFFDKAFFAYREDADVSWRGQRLGWNFLYWPKAIAWHERRVTQERRRALPPEINYHSVKNRFLMRIKNLDGPTYLRHLVPITVRDAGILAYMLLLERSSLPALSYVWRHRRRYFALRRELKQRRRRDSRAVAEWFAKDIEYL